MLLNRDRALGVMKDFGLDALLGTTPVNMTYLSDYSPWLHWVYRLYTREKFQFQHYALFPRDRGVSAAIIAPNRPSNLAYWAEWPSWIEDLYLYGPAWDPGPEPLPEHPPEMHRLYKAGKMGQEKGSKTAGEALVRALRDRGLTRGVIAVDTEGIDPAQLQHARRELPDIQWKEAGELFRYIRMVKTPDEIALLRQAAEVNWEGFKALLKAAVPGNTEIDLSRAYRAGASLAGGVPVFCNNACGPWAVNHWEPRTYALKPGDTVYCDAGCTYRYYNADTNVSAVLGEPTRRHRELFQAMSDGLSAATAVVRPGVRLSEVLAAFREGTLAGGAVKSFSGFGHAVGLEARDLPMIQAPFPTVKDEVIEVSADFVLEAGMVFNLEDAKRELGLGSVAVEDTLLVTSTGCESLVPQEREIVILPA